MCLFVKRRRNPVDSNGGSKGIRIPDPVSHNEQLILRLHQLSHGVGLYPGLYPGGLLQLLGLAAVVGDLGSVLHHRLVAAAAQSHVNGCSGVLVVSDIGLSVHTHTDTQRHSHLVADVDRFNLLQKGEPLLLKLLRILLLNDKEIFVFFQFLHNTV